MKSKKDFKESIKINYITYILLVAAIFINIRLMICFRKSDDAMKFLDAVLTGMIASLIFGLIIDLTNNYRLSVYIKNKKEYILRFVKQNFFWYVRDFMCATYNTLIKDFGVKSADGTYFDKVGNFQNNVDNFYREYITEINESKNNGESYTVKNRFDYSFQKLRTIMKNLNYILYKVYDLNQYFCEEEICQMERIKYYFEELNMTDLCVQVSSFKDILSSFKTLFEFDKSFNIDEYGFYYKKGSNAFVNKNNQSVCPVSSEYVACDDKNVTSIFS